MATRKSKMGSDGVAKLNGSHVDEGDVVERLEDDDCESVPIQVTPETSTEATSVAPPPAEPTRKRTKYLECKLSAKERGELSGKMMRALCEMKELDGKIESSQNVTKGLKKERDVVEERALDLAQQRARGSAWRDVEIVESEGIDERDESASEIGVVTRRIDTMAIVEWRPLQFSERQGDLWRKDEIRGRGTSADI